MENNTPPSKLDETIKEHLSNYDAKYDSGDWSRMERMLDAAPTSIAPKIAYNKVIVIGASVLVGIFLIYKVVSSSKTSPETTVADDTTTVAPSENETKATVTPAPAVAKNTTTITPAVKEQPAVIPSAQTIIPEVKTVAPEIKISIAAADLKEKTKKEQQKATTLDPEQLKNQKISVMGKEPIFGDQIDSSKGIVRETQEKESTKKAAVSKGSNTVGLGVLFLNADSIKKQQERMQKDTLHK